ncbi:phage putative head morphogenesis protein, SPP1 gp7 family [Paenisporosarcina quisquiliarum]|nr:phage putative head morphogenesis protein, SPP1 gp7 family [Paenisporosarcina quisquiliarum]
MSKSSDYWKQRFEFLLESQLSNAEEYSDELEEIYNLVIEELEKDISKWYTRFAKNNEISLSEAKKMLRGSELAEFHWDVQEYIAYGERNALNGRWMRQLENASARVHISRLESIKIQTQQVIEKLYASQSEGVDRLMRQIYQDTYYHTAFEIQTGFNVGYTLQSINETQLQQVLSKPWTADAVTFSDRIWRNKDELINTLHTELTQFVIRGDSPDKVISTIARKLNVSRSKAGRLVMTESAFFASAAQKNAFNELDVERYEIVATLDMRTSSICQELDGKVFAMSDFAPGITAPPFHPWCRTVTVPYFDDDYGQRMARDLEGKTYYVPGNMKYADWYQSQIEKNGEEKINHVKKLLRNLNKDKEQYIKYQKSLGKDTPISFEEFQNLKYSNKIEWNKLQDNYYVKSRIKDGTFGSLINPEKQLPHMQSTQKEGKSYFYDDVDVQKIFNQYAGTGTIERDSNGKRKNTEIIDITGDIAVVQNKEKKIPANQIKIHHSKKRTHIVPRYNEERG